MLESSGISYGMHYAPPLLERNWLCRPCEIQLADPQKKGKNIVNPLADCAGVTNDDGLKE